MDTSYPRGSRIGRRKGRSAAGDRNRRLVQTRRLLCEPLEDRRLLSVSISNLVWSDLNANGVQELSEPGVAGAAVEVFSSPDAVVGNADDVSHGVAITGANGQYAFTGLPDGLSYYLVFRTPVGYTITGQDLGGDDALDSDADSLGVTSLFTIAAGQTDASRDAGLVGAAPGFGFAFRAGDDASDVGNATTVDALGNVYVTGYFNGYSTGAVDFDPGPGICNLTTSGGTGVFVAKYSSTGALVWAHQIEGGYGAGWGIALGADGSVYSTGYFGGSVDFDPGPGVHNLTSAGQGDVFITKLDTTGNFVWARAMGGIGNDAAYGIAVEPDGSVYTTGYFVNTADFDPGPEIFNLTATSSGGIFVSKLDVAGNFVWARAVTSSSWLDSRGIAVDGTGNVYTTGYFYDSVDFDPGAGMAILTSAGKSDIFVSKLDATGGLVWARAMGGHYSYEEANDIAVDSSGNVYTTGRFSGTADFDPGGGVFNLTCAGYNDVFVSKLDVLGNFVWARGIGGGQDDNGWGIAVDAEGSVYSNGEFGGSVDFDPGIGIVTRTSVGGIDVFVLKLDVVGDFVWARTMGGSGVERSYELSLAADGSVCITGDFAGTADFDPGPGTFSLTSAIKKDIFLSKLLPIDPPTSIALSVASVAENVPAGTTVGAFSTTDPNANDTFTYTLVSGTGSTDNASFTIDAGGNLLTNAVFDYETKSSYSIRVRSTDAGGLSTEKAFTISVTNTAPTVTGIYARNATLWNSGYLNMLAASNLGTAAGGVRLTDGSFQILKEGELTWSNLNQISIAFSEGVTITQDALRLVNSSNLDVAQSAYSYDALSNTATWTFTNTLGRNRYLIALDAAKISDGVGWNLDGEWETGVTTYATSGNGTAGGNLFFLFNLLPGDVNTSSATNISDLNGIRSQISAAPGASNFRLDVNGTNTINISDLSYNRSQIGTNLTSVPTPTIPPTGMSALQAAEMPTSQATASIDAQILAPIVADAIARWDQSGLDAAGLALLQSVQFEVVDFADSPCLGSSLSTLVRIDNDAAGWGWFVDTTPTDDAEFAPTAGGSLQATVDGPAAGRMDLLTAVMHELGHQLGLPDQSFTDSLMSATLTSGTRLLPSASAPSEMTQGPLAPQAVEQAFADPGASDPAVGTLIPPLGTASEPASPVANPRADLLAGRFGPGRLFMELALVDRGNYTEQVVKSGQALWAHDWSQGKWQSRSWWTSGLDGDEAWSDGDLRGARQARYSRSLLAGRVV